MSPTACLRLPACRAVVKRRFPARDDADHGHSLIVLERETTTPGRPIRYRIATQLRNTPPRQTPVAEGKGFEPLIARKMRRGSPLDLLLRERDRGFESLFLQRRVCEPSVPRCRN